MFVTTPKDDIIGTKPKDVDLSKSSARHPRNGNQSYKSKLILTF